MFIVPELCETNDLLQLAGVSASVCVSFALCAEAEAETLVAERDDLAVPASSPRGVAVALASVCTARVVPLASLIVAFLSASVSLLICVPLSVSGLFSVSDCISL